MVTLGAIAYFAKKRSVEKQEPPEEEEKVQVNEADEQWETEEEEEEGQQPVKRKLFERKATGYSKKMKPISDDEEDEEN